MTPHAIRRGLRSGCLRPDKLADLFELWDRHVEENGVIIEPVSVYEVDAETQ
jgi:arylsulfatase